MPTKMQTDLQHIMCSKHGIYYPQLVGHECPDCIRDKQAEDEVVFVQAFGGGGLTSVDDEVVDKLLKEKEDNLKGEVLTDWELP